ncbi:MAG: TrkA C-terminal domain-containing protein [Candidatus Limnocylindrales bacterium]
MRSARWASAWRLREHPRDRRLSGRRPAVRDDQIRAPQAWVGRTFKDLDRATMQLSPVGLCRGAEVMVNPHRDVVLAADDELIVLGPRRTAGADRALTTSRCRPATGVNPGTGRPPVRRPRRQARSHRPRIAAALRRGAA